MEFFPSLGFDENPFEHTNADQEERLPDYFVPPPYFDAVFGNPENPQSHIVFAPRGGGKTAQRRMVEHRCNQSDVLAITYDQFDFIGVDRATDVTLHHHLRNVIRSIVVAILIDLDSQHSLMGEWSKEECELFTSIAAENLDGLTAIEFKQILNSIRSLKDRFKNFWNEWLPAIGPGLKVITHLLKSIVTIADFGELSTFRSEELKDNSTLKHQLEISIQLAKRIGWKSIYVLVDRVDESELTGNNAKDSFAIVEPLVKDLQLLETDGIAFKFFLWDQLQSSYQDIARTDRIKQDTLDWDREMLLEMWKKRISTFSDEKILELTSISEKTTPYNLDEIAYIFANKSPRDMIRIGNRVLSEQKEIDPHSNLISKESIYLAISKLCTERTKELVRKDGTIRDLKKIRQIDFTNSYLASQVFKTSTNASRRRITLWSDEGIIALIDQVDAQSAGQKRTVKLYAIKDIRVAKEMFPELKVPVFLETKVRLCSQCDAFVLRDWGDNDSSTVCHNCQYDLMNDIVKGPDAWKYHSPKRSRRRQHTNSEDGAEQLELFDPENIIE